LSIHILVLITFWYTLFSLFFDVVSIRTLWYTIFSICLNFILLIIWTIFCTIFIFYLIINGGIIFTFIITYISWSWISIITCTMFYTLIWMLFFLCKVYFFIWTISYSNFSLLFINIIKVCNFSCSTNIFSTQARYINICFFVALIIICIIWTIII